MKIERVYHHFRDCEENAAGMWRTVAGMVDRECFIQDSARLMRNVEGFHKAMRRATKEWPFSCEHNLTGQNINRRAWLGHAGCCIAHKAPEELTRLGWHKLNQAEQNAANAAADAVIEIWESEYEIILSKGLRCRNGNLALTF